MLLIYCFVLFVNQNWIGIAILILILLKENYIQRFILNVGLFVIQQAEMLEILSIIIPQPLM